MIPVFSGEKMIDQNRVDEKVAFAYNALGLPKDHSQHIYTNNFREFLGFIRKADASKDDIKITIDDAISKRYNHNLKDVFVTEVREGSILHYGWMRSRKDSTIIDAVFADYATDISIMRMPVLVETAIDVTRSASSFIGEKANIENRIREIKELNNPLLCREKAAVVAQLGGLMYDLSINKQAYDSRMQNIKYWHDRLHKPKLHESLLDDAMTEFYGGSRRKDTRMSIASVIYDALGEMSIGNQTIVSRFMTKMIGEIAASNDVFVYGDDDYWISTSKHFKKIGSMIGDNLQIEESMFTTDPIKATLTILDREYLKWISGTDDAAENIAEWEKVLGSSQSLLPYSKPFRPALGLRELY
jgi:hypothetical protein